jgi:hypothetical protein
LILQGKILAKKMQKSVDFNVVLLYNSLCNRLKIILKI